MSKKIYLEHTLSQFYLYFYIFFITIGGGNRDGLSSTLTEIYRGATNSFEAGPTLPIGVRDHCTVKINTTAYAIIGGYINEDPNDLTVSID